MTTLTLLKSIPPDQTSDVMTRHQASVVMSNREAPRRNSSMLAARSSGCMSPRMLQTLAPLSCICLVKPSTFVSESQITNVRAFLISLQLHVV